MSDLKINVPGNTYIQEQAISQFAIPAGAGATWSNTNNICTVTTNAAHGLTLNPASGVPANYFIRFDTAFTVLTGTGVGLGQIFRILAIPSTTTFQVYSTILTATVTSTTFTPIFYPILIPAGPFVTGASVPPSWLGGPTQTISAVAYNEPPLLVGSGNVNFVLGANCLIQYAPNDYSGTAGTISTPLDSTVNGGVTPSVAPVFRTAAAASTNGQLFMPSYSSFIAASGTTASSFFSVIQ